MENLQIVKTADGSDTIYLSELDETYHSIFGAIQEANHIFINNGVALVKKENITVFEVGFGTGLNALLTAKYAIEKNLDIEYISIEKFPLQSELLLKLNYANHSNPEELLFRKIHDAEWDRPVQINSNFRVQKIHQDILNPEFQIEREVDIIYFDAFAPSKQSEIWDEKIFKLLYNSLNLDGMLITYSSAGIVKKALRSAGFKVRRLIGPPGKHHILLARKEAI